jgi:hypothetical protein
MGTHMQYVGTTYVLSAHTLVYVQLWSVSKGSYNLNGRVTMVFRTKLVLLLHKLAGRIEKDVLTYSSLPYF